MNVSGCGDASRYGVELNFGDYRILLSGRESAPYMVKGTPTKIRARAFNWHIVTDDWHPRRIARASFATFVPPVCPCR